MANTSESIAKALLLLSNNVNLIDARGALLQGLTEDTLKDVTEHCMRELLSRNELEDALCGLLGRTAQAPTRPEAELLEATPSRAANSPDQAPLEHTNDAMTGLKTRISTSHLPDEIEVELLLRIVTREFGVGRPFWYENINRYPSLQQWLAEKISADFCSSDVDVANFVIEILAQPFAYLTEDICLKVFFDPDDQAARCTFLKSDKKTGYSCDSCIDQRKLCVRPVHFEGLGSKLVVHPLPKRLREGRLAENKYYWVRQ